MTTKRLWIVFYLTLLVSCKNDKTNNDTSNSSDISIIVLGTIQDAGSPHIACKKECCKDLFDQPDPDRQVISLGLIDGIHDKKYLFEATPDIGRQLKTLKNTKLERDNELPDGIFITHAHIGHYAGLMYLGKEAMNAAHVPVYVMPKMNHFLQNNGPWDQLVANNNIALKTMEHKQPVVLSKELQVIPILVPHRDEYSETVGYKIIGPHKSALFIPDIDKWEKWERDIINEIKQVDYAFLDATFYSGQEIDNRDISQIPHPFIMESMKKFSGLSDKEKSKIIFIHFNHTNPVIDPASEASQTVLKNGFQIARIDQKFDL